MYAFCPVQLFMTPWTVKCQPPLSIGFSKNNTEMGCHFLLQGIFLTQGLKLHFLHWQVICLPLSQWEIHIKHTHTHINIYMLQNFMFYAFINYVNVKKYNIYISHVQLCDPMNCSPPGSSVHEILQTRILEWAAILFSRSFA